jgi:thiol-disulfide isomerase/thioredoxin
MTLGFRRVPRLAVVLLAFVVAAAAAIPDASAQPEELPLGSPLPSVDAPLTRADGSTVAASDLTGSTATVFLFWSNQCPWVDKYEERVQAIVSDFGGQGIRVVRVNANDAGAFPKESLEACRQRADDRGYETPYVRDDRAALARALGASRTPHAFVFDDSQTLVYAGAIDNSPADPENVTKSYLRDALDALVSGSSIPVADTKAFGCTLKYP